MSLRPCPVCNGRAPQARGARRHGRRPLDLRVHADVGDAGARLPRRARPDGDRAADRDPDLEGDPRAADVPRRRRRRLPHARPRGGDALGRRGAAAPARDADRLAARRRPLHPRRAVDRPPPARQRAPDRDARAAARHRQHRRRRRARRGDDARAPTGSSTWGRAPACTAARSSPKGPAAKVERNKKSVTGQFLSGTREIAVPERRDEDRGSFTVRGAAQHNLKEHRRRVPGRQVHLRDRRLGLGQVDARERDRLQGAREPAQPRARQAGRARRASTGSTSSTR